MDVLEGFVSAEAARTEYGVVLGQGLAIDTEATKKLRDSMKKGG
jgi:hypothetical protein